MRRRFAIKVIVPLLFGASLAVAGYAAGRSEVDPGPARFLSSLELRAKPNWFGGFSAISVAADGQKVVLLTDRSHLLEGVIERQADRISGLLVHSHNQLRNRKGQTMTSGRDSVDSEGLALAPDGALFVSFEGQARVSRYNSHRSAAQDLPRPKAFRVYEDNKALEALGIDSHGQLYTVPENSPGDQFPVWRWDGAEWEQPFSISKYDGYLPVGLDIGPDGRFYLLERKFVWIGFRSRLRRWDLSDEGLTNETELLRTGLAAHDNLEGLSVWRTATGGLRATMVSDDNFMPFQRSELVEYHLPN